MSPTNLTSNRDLQDIVRAALAAGWDVAKTGANHIRFKGPKGFLYFTGSSPSDSRAVRNARSALRRGGLPI